MALIQRGGLLAIDTPAAVTNAFDRALFEVRAGERYPALRVLRTFPHVHSVYPFGEALHYTDARVSAPPAQVAREVASFLEANGITGARATVMPPTIEDTFIARMGAPEGEDAEAGVP